MTRKKKMVPITDITEVRDSQPSHSGHEGETHIPMAEGPDANRQEAAGSSTVNLTIPDDENSSSQDQAETVPVEHSDKNKHDNNDDDDPIYRGGVIETNHVNNGSAGLRAHGAGNVHADDDDDDENDGVYVDMANEPGLNGLNGGVDVSSRNEFVPVDIERIRDHFTPFMDTEQRLGMAEFKQAIGDKKDSFFAERFFHYLEKDGHITLNELAHGANQLLNGTSQHKLGFVFSLYDMNGDGEITREELYKILMASVKESHIHINERNLNIMTDALFDEADEDKDGLLTHDEFVTLLSKYPDVVDGVTQSAASWLQPSLKDDSKAKKKPRSTKNYIKNNRAKLGFYIVFILLNCGFFALNAWLFRDSNGWIIFARGCGMALDFCSALVILLPLRMSLSYLRTTFFAAILPLDHNIFLHKIVGWTIVFWSILHTIGHLGNAKLLTDYENITIPEILFTREAGYGWVLELAPLTGVILFVIVGVMFVMALPFVRRSGYFETFYWTHKLYIAYYVICILHTENFWKWVVAPCLLLLTEQLVSFVRSRTTNFHIQSVAVLPSGVTQLEIKRHPDFQFHAGDYVYLNIPVIAKYEWHPFTISSAPEQEQTFWVHIRSAGHWTKSVREHFMSESIAKTYSKPAKSLNIRQRRASSIAWFAQKTSVARAMAASIRRRAIYKRTHVPVYVDGPYGSACRSIFNTEHAILIGAGIGVTPFASILQSICFRFKDTMVTCPSCDHRFHTESFTTMKLRKVDFIWINRDNRQFEWFTNLLAGLERDMARGLGDALHLHMFLTGAPKRDHVHGVGVQVALDIVHSNKNTDLLTGLRTRTQAGRPNFHKLLGEIKSRSQGFKRKVFFCGAPALSKTVRQECIAHDIGFSAEQF